MKKSLWGFLIALIMTAIPSYGELPPVRVSYFSQLIEMMARQSGMSYYDAAKTLRDMGYEGVECLYNIKPENLKILDELGYQHACAIAHIDITKDDCQEELDKAIQFMLDNNFKQILLVPGLFDESPTQAQYDALYKRWNAFVKKAGELGLTVLVECFDNVKSPIMNMAGIDKAMENVDDLKQAFDIGNFMFAGDDPMVAYRHFKPTIRHLHMKDRPEGGKGFSNIGYGTAPIKEIVNDLRQSGYDGWYVMELYGTRNLLEDSRISMEAFQKIIKEGDK